MKMSQHALIIGGTKGIGKATANLFAEEGRLVSVIGRTAPSLEGKNTINYYQLDLAKHDRISTVLKKAINPADRKILNLEMGEVFYYWELVTSIEEIERVLGI